MSCWFKSGPFDYTYYWTINGDILEDFTESDLPGTYFVKGIYNTAHNLLYIYMFKTRTYNLCVWCVTGDVIVCWITPSDDTSTGEAYSSSALGTNLIISNSPPYVENLQVISDTGLILTDSELTCSFDGPYDADNDTDLTTYYSWSVLITYITYITYIHTYIHIYNKRAGGGPINLCWVYCLGMWKIC